MKILFAAALVAGATFVYAGSSTAMPMVPQDNHSLVQTVKDPTCNAPSRTARCKWYGMPGVHKGPKWLRQSQPGTHHHKKVKHPKHKVHHTMTPDKMAPDKMTPGPGAAPAPTPQTSTPAPSTPPATTTQPATPTVPQQP
jgi:hypothetical protein